MDSSPGAPANNTSFNIQSSYFRLTQTYLTDAETYKYYVPKSTGSVNLSPLLNCSCKTDVAMSTNYFISPYLPQVTLSNNINSAEQ